MTVYFAGGEDVDFVNLGLGGFVTTGGGTFRSSYARCSLATGTANVTAFWRASGALNGSTGLSSWWFSAQLWANSFNGLHVINFTDGSDRNRLFLKDDANGTSWSLVKRTIAGTETTLGSFAITWVGLLKQLVIQVISYGPSGEVKVWYDGVLLLDYSGDIATDGETVLKGLDLGGYTTSWSEVVIADQDLRAISLCTLAPSGLGNADTFSGFTGSSAVNSVNKTTIDDSSYVDSATAAQIEQFTTGSLPSGNFTVLGVKVSARAAAGANGPQHMDVGFRSGGSDSWSSDFALNPSFANYGALFQASPWPAATLGAGFNIGIKSVA